MAVGDIVESGCNFADNQIRIRFRSEVTAERTVDGDMHVTTATPVAFAYIDRRTVRTGTIHGYNFDGGTVDEQYLSADPDNPTWHTIRNNMRRFFSDGSGCSGGFAP